MKNRCLSKITVIIIGYHSTNKIITFVRKIPKIIKVIVVDNSNDKNLRKKLKKFKNIKIYLKKNLGFASAINFAFKKIKTEYFFQISPDLIFDFKKLIDFYQTAKIMKNKFCSLGPRFMNVDEKGHKQIPQNLKIESIESIHGSAMFICCKVFRKLRGFDENFFLYFEETDFCKRGNKIGYKSYQINKIKVYKKGETVNVNKKQKKKLSNLLTWHFIWSKYNCSKKHNGLFITIFNFIPILIRTMFKIMINKILRNQSKLEKYRFRYSGLKSAFLGKKSYYRID